jgi:hypothetical protein
MSKLESLLYIFGGTPPMPKVFAFLLLRPARAQAAGKIAPGVDVKARAQFAMGVSYRF